MAAERQAAAGRGEDGGAAGTVRIGPPVHERGAIVFGEYDQVELDACYDQRVYAPLGEQIIRRLVAESEAARLRLGEPERLRYGASEREGIDLYRTARPNAPIFLFIHGGAWRVGAARNCAYPAELFVTAGAHYLAADFALIDEVGGDLGAMARQVRAAVAWTWRNAAAFGGDPTRLYLGGHSSGGHLAAVALTTDWEAEFGVPPDIVKGGLCMSGMYDLAPVRLSYRSSYVKFTDAVEEALSPLRHIAQVRAPLTVTYGENETPEFQRQGRDFAAALKAAGKPVELIVAPHSNHFEMSASLASPFGTNGRAALAMMGLSLRGG
jgi:arylformamidase